MARKQGLASYRHGSGRIDPEDIAISLAIAEEDEMSDEDDEEQE